MSLNRNNRGFQLIELILVMTLVGILAGVYTTTVNLDSNALDRAARRLETDLRYAQRLASAEEIAVGFQTTGPTVYQVYRGAPGVLVLDPLTKQGLNLDLTTDYQNVSFGGTYQVEFDPTGQPTLGAGTSIVLQSGGDTRTITVLASTGYIQIQ